LEAGKINFKICWGNIDLISKALWIQVSLLEKFVSRAKIEQKNIPNNYAVLVISKISIKKSSKNAKKVLFMKKNSLNFFNYSWDQFQDEKLGKICWKESKIIIKIGTHIPMFFFKENQRESFSGKKLETKN